MANVFYTKKVKAKMRERRRRKMKAGTGGHGDRGGGGDSGNETTAPAASNHGQSKQSGLKRTADQITNGHAEDLSSARQSIKNWNVHGQRRGRLVTITVPAGLTSKEAKKFRKDARRRFRVAGQAEDQIEFMVEGQRPPKESFHDGPSESGGGKQDDIKGDVDKKKAKQQKTFPRINDLLSLHAAREKMKEKLAKQQSADATLPDSEREKYIAVDCEMVGVGPGGKKSALARASAVQWDGRVLLDTFVRVPERVTDFRTSVSGVRARDINAKNQSAMDHNEVRDRMGKLLLGKVLVGHALKNDLSALMLSHPREDIRDTARYKPFMRAAGRSGGKLRPRKLRDLVREELGRTIQVEGEAHCSVDDARASMDLFRSVRGKWEKELEGKKKGGGGGRGQK